MSRLGNCLHGVWFPVLQCRAGEGERIDFKANNQDQHTSESWRAIGPIHLYINKTWIFTKYLQKCCCDHGFPLCLQNNTSFIQILFIHILVLIHSNIMSLLAFTVFYDPYAFCFFSCISSCSLSYTLCFIQTRHVLHICSVYALHQLHWDSPLFQDSSLPWNMHNIPQDC